MATVMVTYRSMLFWWPKVRVVLTTGQDINLNIGQSHRGRENIQNGQLFFVTAAQLRICVVFEVLIMDDFWDARCKNVIKNNSKILQNIFCDF